VVQTRATETQLMRQAGPRWTALGSENLPCVLSPRRGNNFGFVAALWELQRRQQRRPGYLRRLERLLRLGADGCLLRVW
jgi:hypothetical protein